MKQMTLDGSLRPGIALLCLGALDPEMAGAPAFGSDAGWLHNARRLLDHARLSAWSVAHVFSAEQHDQMAKCRSMPGFGPLPSEPVFYRHSASAFSSPACETFADMRRNDILLMLGASLDACCLTTAVNGVRAGRSMAVAEDAILSTPVERKGLADLRDISSRCGLGSIRLETSSRLTGIVRYIHVIRGGRA